MEQEWAFSCDVHDKGICSDTEERESSECNWMWHLSFRGRQRSIAPSWEMALSGATFTHKIISNTIHIAATSPSHLHTSPSHPKRMTLQFLSNLRLPANRWLITRSYQKHVWWLLVVFHYIIVCVHCCFLCIRVEEWRRGRLVRIPHILLSHTVVAAPKQPIRSQYFILLLVRRAHRSRA